MGGYEFYQRVGHGNLHHLTVHVHMYLEYLYRERNLLRIYTGKNRYHHVTRSYTFTICTFRSHQ